jgi:uncharacterized protein YbjT (DUF2867 family)
MSAFTAAELAYLRTKLRLARVATVTLFQPRFVMLVKGDAMTTSILVTGGTGTLGRPVAQRLRDAGASVTVLSRHPRETAEGIRYTAGDLSTGEGIEAAVRGAEVIVHAAGSRTGDEQKTRTLVSAAKDARHIVVISVVGADRTPQVSASTGRCSAGSA